MLGISAASLNSAVGSLLEEMAFMRGLGDLSVSMNTWQASKQLAYDGEIALKRLPFQTSLWKKDWKAQSRSLDSREVMEMMSSWNPGRWQEVTR